LLGETGSTQRIAVAQGAGEKAPDGMLEAVQTAGGPWHTTDCLIGSEPAIADVIGDITNGILQSTILMTGRQRNRGPIGGARNMVIDAGPGVAELVSGRVHLGQVPVKLGR
jgi:hypothetical protein